MDNKCGKAILALSSLLTVLGLAQPISLGQGDSRGPRQSSTTRTYTNIRQVDFKNFAYESEGNVIRMRRGAGKDGEDKVSVDQITYGDLTRDGREDAVVLLGGRGAGNQSYYTLGGFIFTLERGSLKVLTTIEGGDVRGSGGAILDPIRIQNGVLVVGRHTGSQYDQVYIESRKYRWEGSQLIEIEQPLRRPYQ